MANYLLLLRGGNYRDMDEDEKKALIEKFYSWVDELTENGAHVASQELKPTGRILRGNKGRFVDGPFAETKEAVGGFFWITAESYDEALDIAKGCPHLLHDGEVEIREINSRD